MIEHEHRQAANIRNAIENGDPIDNINTDDEADDAEYELWKLRELRRLKRDKVMCHLYDIILPKFHEYIYFDFQKNQSQA